MDFELSIEQWTKGLRAELIPDFQRKITFEAFTRIVQRTPRDTGRAANSWIVSVGEPDDTVADQGAGGRTGDPPNAFQLAEAAARLRALKAGDDSYVQTNLDYPQYLEDGSSRQAPAGMVRVTVMEIEQAFR